MGRHRTRPGILGRRLLAGVTVAALAAGVVAAVALPSAAGAAGTATYTATKTFPVPPASSYAGTGGGDGWGLAFSVTQVFNIFHHSSSLTVACHEQSDASACYSPKTITDPVTGTGFTAGSRAGLWIDAGTGKLYVFTTRTDATGGAVCVDTTQAATNTDPFCGFTPLTAPGGADLSVGYSSLSETMQIGARLYAFNYASNRSVPDGEFNRLLCFDTTTHAPCAGQPFAVSLGAGTLMSPTAPGPGVAAIGGKLIITGLLSSGTAAAGCFDPTTGGGCAGTWPVTSVPTSYPATNGAPFPLLSATGTLTGFCVPSDIDQCWDMSGSSVPTPAGMAGVISATSPYNGQAVVLGPRVYVPNGNADQVECFDYAVGGPCSQFPHSIGNLGGNYMYSVNVDPARPTCLWVNSDSGPGQIQNFDAYTGKACGQGPIRVLASSFVVSTQLCQPASYTSLHITSPAPGSYTSGTVGFQDADANPIAGLPTVPLDATGAAALSGLNLSTAYGLPQFLITLNGASGAPAAVTVTLTWTGTDDATCAMPGTTTTGGAGSGVVVSFGDSIAAGEGSGPHTGYPDNDNAYSARLASRLGWKSYNFAISGGCAATSGRGGVWGTPSECTKSVITDEIPAAAAMNLKPSLVTLTVGANDIRFADCVIQVLGFASTSPCTGQTFTDHLQALKLNLGMALAKIRDLYGSTVPIAVTSYFSPMPGYVSNAKDACTAMPGLALAKTYQDQGAQKAVWAVRDLDSRALDYQNSVNDRTLPIIEKLNRTLTKTATPFGAKMVALDFSGHDFCTDYDGHADAWVLAPQVDVFASYYGAGGASFGRDLVPAHRCVTTPSCDTKTLFVSKSGDWNGQHWTFILNFWSNDFPHLTKPGHEAVAARIIATLGLK